jgi:hypothetical protein
MLKIKRREWSHWGVYNSSMLIEVMRKKIVWTATKIIELNISFLPECWFTLQWEGVLYFFNFLILYNSRSTKLCRYPMRVLLRLMLSTMLILSFISLSWHCRSFIEYLCVHTSKTSFKSMCTLLFGSSNKWYFRYHRQCYVASSSAYVSSL